MGVLSPETFALPPADDAAREVVRLRRRLDRERQARTEAEAIAERGLRETYLANQRIDLLQRIAAKANEASYVRDALGYALAEICATTDWAFGNAYLVDPQDPDRLLPADLWHACDPAGLTAFIDDSIHREFRVGEGLPGRVLASQRPAWLCDLSHAENFPRRDVARAVGLNAAFAFPVLVQDEVAAVLEFFARPNVPEDEAILALMGQIGTQLGRVIERERFAAQLMHDALHDPLTGLPNRMLFTERVSRAIARRARGTGGQVAVLFLDLDGFKLINDSHGHLAGDQVLSTTALRLKATLEQGAARRQTGWPDWTLARLGGDEFIVLLEDFSDEALAHEIADALLAVVNAPHQIGDREVHSGVSIGIAFALSPKVTAQDLLRKADTAMYEAKARGRGQVAVFDKALRKRAQVRLQTENDLRAAIGRDEFQLHYQPIVDLKSNRLTGFEALLRWQRPGTELVGPGNFIGVAEETGLIVAIGGWVLREACEATARWHRLFPERKPVTISINVSPRQFLQPRFAELVREVLRDTGIAPGTVALEITESIAIASPERAVTVMREVRALGVRLSLDDFGTGYSSLGHLHRYPFNTLKLDRSFVQDLCEPRNDASAGIVRAVLDLATSMKLAVVAEGIETTCQRRALRDMGCQFAQGYLYSRPLAPEAAELLIARHR